MRKHKPFNLGEALTGKPVIMVGPTCPNGRAVQKIYHIPEADTRTVAAVVGGCVFPFNVAGYGYGDVGGYELYMAS